MAAATRQVPTSDGLGPHLVLYDGSCGLCHGLVQFILQRDPVGRFHFAPQEGPSAALHFEQFGLRGATRSTVYLVLNYRGDHPTYRVKARAALAIFAALGWPWRMASLFYLLPTACLDWGYDLVARNRHRFAGHREACLMPRTTHADRFPDEQMKRSNERKDPR